MFQVMGFNYVMCGYGCVNEMVKDMCTGEDKQLEAFARFIKLAGLRPNLERKDWTGFAKRYNGSGYAQNQYDRRGLSEIYEVEKRYTRFSGVDFCFVPRFILYRV